MQHKIIQGVEVPEIGLGTYQMHGVECQDTVVQALDLGYRHIDTAQIYENEREIGEAINISTVDREEIFLATKVWRTNLAHDDVIRSTEESLKHLDTPYVDLLMIHWNNDMYDLRKTLEAFLLLRDQGKAMNIGVCNFTLPLLKKAMEEIRAPLFCNQVEFHAQLGQFDLLEYALDNDLAITAYSPLGQGELVDNNVLAEIGEKYDKSASQIALRWLIEQQNVITIPKASSEEHLKQNIDIFDFQLTDEEFQRIDQMPKDRRIIDPSFAPDW